MKEPESIKDILEKSNVEELIIEAYKRGYVRGHIEGWNNTSFTQIY